MEVYLVYCAGFYLYFYLNHLIKMNPDIRQIHDTSTMYNMFSTGNYFHAIDI